MTSKKELLKKLLKGIETGDPKAAAVVNEDQCIQHNPLTGEGSPGLAELFAYLSTMNPRVNFIRVFEDGDFAFAHIEYDFDRLEVAFEVFRFEEDKAVEHWDNIQTQQPPNPSGRSMLDGEVAIINKDETEINRSLARSFVEEVLIKRQFDWIESCVADDLIQHDPDSEDGAGALRSSLQALLPDGTAKINHHRLHRVLAEGNFALCMCEGSKENRHSGLYHLFRFADRKIVEHWSVVSPIAPRNEWKNENGKF